jgi:hypothetical protein
MTNIPPTIPSPQRTTVDTDPNNPYITLVLAPSQLLPFVELAHIMERKWNYEDDPVGAAGQADRALQLIRVIGIREHGMAEMIPDDLWESVI